MPVESAVGADVLLVTANAPQGPTQFLVDTGAPGVEIAPVGSLDLVRRFGEVQLSAVAVGAEALLGQPGGGAAAADRQLQLVGALQCAEMVGAAQRVFDFTLEYAFDRHSFGRPLASYQALKHRFADMKLWLESCHATAAGAARAVADGAPEAAELVSVAKAFIGERAPAILQDCVQMHGGIGVTWDHDLHLYIRRVTQDRALYGTPADHRERVATLIGL